MNIVLRLTSLSLWPFLRVARMPTETYRALITGAKAELRDSKYKLYYKVYGRSFPFFARH